jgi:hypothetical protein
MKYKIEQLRTISNIIFDHLLASNISCIELPQDYYWWISKEDLYDPINEPKDMSVGQLSDDWSELQKILESQNVVGYSLVWLSAILRAIGEEVVC